MSNYGTPPPQDPTSPYGSTPPPAQGTGAKGFFGALFDFKFEHFITPMIVKVVYILATVGLVLGWLVFMLVSFAAEPVKGVLVLLFGPILVVLYLAFIRMTLEFYLAIVRMSEDIHQRLR